MSQKGMISVYKCNFTIQITKVQVVNKLPCQIVLQCKQSNQNIICTIGGYKPVQGVASINQKLQIQQQLIFDQHKQQFIKKELTLFVNFINLNKLDIVKQLGRIIINLGQVANNKGPFLQLKYQRLMYCPSNSNIQLSIAFIEGQPINKSLDQINQESLQIYRSNYPKVNIQVFTHQDFQSSRITNHSQKIKQNQAKFKVSLEQSQNSKQIFSKDILNQNQRQVKVSSSILNELEQEIKEKAYLLSDYDQKINQNMTLKFQLSELKNKFQQILKLVNQKDNQIQRLQQEMNVNSNNFKFQYLKLKQQTDKTHKDLKKEQSQVHQLKEKIKLIEHTLIKVNQSNQLFQKQKLFIENQYQNKVKEIKQIKKQNSKLKNSLAQIQGKNINLINLENERELAFKKLKIQNQSKDAEIKQTRQQISLLNKKFEQKIIQNQVLIDRQVKFAQKQQKMRQNVQILQQQSRKIFEIVSSKEQIEQEQTRKIEQQQITIKKLLDRVYQYQNKQSLSFQAEIFQKKLIQSQTTIKNQKQELQFFKLAFAEINIPTKTQDKYQTTLLQDKLNKLNQQNKDMLDAKLQLENIFQKQQSRRIALQSQKIQFLDKIKELNQKVNQLQNNLNLITTQKIKIQQSKLQLQKKILNPNTSNKQVNILQSLTQQKQIQIDNLKKQINSKNQKIKNFQDMSKILERQQKEIQRLQQELQAIRIKSNVKHDDIDQLRQENIVLRSQIIQLKNQANISLQQQNVLNSESQNDILPITKTERKLLEQQIQRLQKQLIQISQNNQKQMKVIFKENQYQNQRNKKRMEEVNLNFMQLKKINEQKEQELKRQNAALKQCIKKQKRQNWNSQLITKQLRQLLEKREKREELKAIVQLLNGNKKVLEDKIDLLTEDRGLMQQKARSLSMEYQKLKSYILKSNKNSQQKSQLLIIVKPSQKIINQIVRISETLSDKFLQDIYDH